jgi:hypothetical protein
MKIEMVWGGEAQDINGESGGQSSFGLPVGEWFDIEMSYQWTTDATTISVWVNGELALEQSGVQTRLPQHVNVEAYGKFYGSDQGRTPWSPSPSLKYTRNVRVAAERIWR